MDKELGCETSESTAEVDNLMYEIESAKRQIASLQAMLAARANEVARLQNQLIDREVLLKQAAVCISEATELCRQQTEQMDHTKRSYQSYEEAWQVLLSRLDRMQEQMPAVPVASVMTPGTGNRLEEARSAVGGSMRRAQESLRQIFEEA